MDKKEAIKNIIYNLKEIEGTRIRLSASKTETVDLELALLNQQVINLYRHLQNYQSGMYTSEPVTAQPKHEEKQEREEKVTIPRPEIQIPEETQPKNTAAVETELKRINNDAALRKERLKRLEAEAEKNEAPQKREMPEPAPKGELEDFTKIVEEKAEEEEIAKEAATISRNPEQGIRNSGSKLSSSEQTLNEKLQSSSKTQESLNEKFAQNDVKKSLADKMKLGPISDLKSAIALNQKIAFTNALFGGDDKEFKKSLAFLNNSTNFSEAKFYLQSDIAKRYGWDDNNPLVEEFTELVYRKFL